MIQFEDCPNVSTLCDAVVFGYASYKSTYKYTGEEEHWRSIVVDGVDGLNTAEQCISVIAEAAVLVWIKRSHLFLFKILNWFNLLSFVRLLFLKFFLFFNIFFKNRTIETHTRHTQKTHFCLQNCGQGHMHGAGACSHFARSMCVLHDTAPTA